MSITAAEYAKYPKTDAATSYGMRLAWGQAMVDLDAKRAAGEKITPQLVKAALHDAANKEPLLKSAGTEKLVSRYIDSFEGTKLQAAYETAAGKLDAKTLAHARDGTANVFELLRAGNAYNSSAMGHLGVKSLTMDFQTKLRDPALGLTKGLRIEPTPLTDSQAKSIAVMDPLFRKADMLDIFHKPVRQLIAKDDAQLEARFNAAAAPLARLSKGQSKHLAADISAVEEIFGGQNAVRPKTAAEAKKWAGHIRDEIVRSRSGVHMKENSSDNVKTLEAPQAPHAGIQRGHSGRDNADRRSLGK